MSLDMCVLPMPCTAGLESQIRITSSCPRAAVDILTLASSHAGLAEPWKVLMVVLKVQELCA